jgi:uncharacterized protein (DUF58 family)
MLVAGITVMVCFAALNTGNNLIYLMAALLLSFLICSAAISLFSLRGLELRRGALPEVIAGEEAKIGVKVTSRRTRANAYAVRVTDGAVSTRERLTGQAFSVRVTPGQTVRLSYGITPQWRGEYRFDEALLVSGFPFGLFSALRRFDLPDCMIVYPCMGKLSRELIRLGQGWGSEKIMRSSKRLGSDEFYGIREYRPGDNPRHIHWRSSARQSKLMLKEFEREEPLGYTIVLDSFADPDDDASLDRLETAISLTASLIDELARHGARIFLIAAMPDSAVVFNGRRSAISSDVLTQLALLGPATEEDVDRLRDAVYEYALGSAHVTAIMLQRDSLLNECLAPERTHGVHIDVIDISDPRVLRGFVLSPGRHLPRG